MENKNDVTTIQPEDTYINPEQFEFVQTDEKIFDKKFETKAVGYFGDALRRFSRNKSSVAGFILICLLIFFAIFGPMMNEYDANYVDKTGLLSYLQPRVPFLEKFGILDGKNEYTACRVSTILKPTDEGYDYKKIRTREQFDARFVEYTSDTYYIKENSESIAVVDIKYDIYSVIVQPYMVDNMSQTEFDQYMQKNALVKQENGEYYISKTTTITSSNYKVILDPVKAGQIPDNPYFLFGTSSMGADLWTQVWKGTRVSLLIGLAVALVTITFGIVWGAISGYYGGTIDIVMERFTEILGGVPWLVIMTLMRLYFGGKLITIVLALVMTSWIGTASIVRMQFYRYKGREYVLASRTLGAKDGRLIFKHILPNGLGPIVTSSVLKIPGAIFFESTVSYLGIGLEMGFSIGNLLSEAQKVLVTYPYLIIPPAFIISILMISFNLFGNGLRDALNPSLRGIE